MDVKLIVTEGRFAGRELPVTGPEFLIGRGEDCQLRPSSDRVSRHHCAIVVEQGRVSVRDFKSRAGTFVNQQRLTEPRVLKNGDRLRVGNLEFEVQLTVTVGGKKKPKVQSIHEAAARTVQAAAGGDELDVSSWLNEQEPAAEGEPGPAASSGSNPEADQSVLPAGAADDSRKDGKPANLFGRTQEAKPASASSREAAADLLRQMFNK